VRRLVVLALLLLSAAPAFGKLESAAWAETEKTFRALIAAPGEEEKKQAAIKAVLEDGEPRAWKALADGLLKESEHVARLAERREKDLAALQVLLAKKLSEMYPADREEMYRLQASVSSVESEKSAEERVLRAIQNAAVAATEPARRVILAAGRGHKEWPARAAVARLAGLSPEEELSKAVLAESLEKEKDARVKWAALEALQGASGTSWYPLVEGRILDSDWTVQIVAARIAGKREMGRAIPKLIEALAKASPRLAEEIVDALRKLTGQSIEPDVGAWSKWWEANRAKWGADGRPLQPVIAAPRPSDVDFYGLKVKSDKVLFVIDISGSMKEEKKAPPAPPKPRGPVTGEPTKPAPEPETKFSGPKIEIAKQELRRAVKKLPKEAMFGIIAFNHSVVSWQPKMVPATDANKDQAYAWIKDMAPAGSTYIDGALRLAFKMAGMGAYDHAYPGVAVDTIILLSDGAPTDNAFPASQNMDPKEILDHVREWNSQNRIIVNCVGIDNVVQGIQFMKDLAKQNGGTYVDG
jgi:hypothetical protein